MGSRSRGIRVKSREQFDGVIDHLVAEIERVLDHWDLLGGLDAARAEYAQELHQSAQFWNLNTQAHQDSVVLRLGRIFDPHPAALSLPNVLQTILTFAMNPTNPTHPDLGLDVSGLDTNALGAELKSVSQSDPVVCRLIAVRNEYLAHRSSQFAVSGSYAGLPRLEREDFEVLLQRACEIGNKYGQLRGRLKLARAYPGRDDYKTMLHLLKLGLRSLREQNRTAIPETTD
jgi:hypothetical protein